MEQIAIAGCVITIDAMGCQYEIADKIVEKGADYVFSLKGNHGNLHDAVEEYWSILDFDKPATQAEYIKFSSISTYDEKHGRKESRDYAVSDDVQWLREQFPQWMRNPFKLVQRSGFIRPSDPVISDQGILVYPGEARRL